MGGNGRRSRTQLILSVPYKRSGGEPILRPPYPYFIPTLRNVNVDDLPTDFY